MIGRRWLLLVVAALVVVALPFVASSGEAIVRVDELGLVDPTTGQWHLRNESGGVTTFYFGNPGDYPFMGDWDGDGVDTPGLYRQSDGYAYLRNSNTQGIADIKFFFGNPGDVPIAGDFNGDGFDTVSIYRPSNQTFYIINKLGSGDQGLGAAELSYVFGNPGDKPFVGDFDGDGIETVGLHRESTGLVYFRNSHTQGIADNQFIYGDPGDRLVAGDWTGNGFDSPGLFRPSNTTWYLRWSNTQGNADESFVWGQSHWLPVAGEFGQLAPTPPTTSTTTTTVPTPPLGFGAGTWVVGVDIPSNTYRNGGFTSGCYWERLSGFSGELSDVIVNNFDSVRQIVEIKPSDAGFSTDSECGTWSTDLSPLKAPTSSFSGGTWQVNSEIAPGRWRNSGFSGGCYWERLSGFSWESEDRITNNFDDVRQIVDIKSGDLGFYTDNDCGTWSMDLTPSKAPTASFGGGFWLVGSEVAAGTWRNTPADTGCYWERLSGFSGESSDRIANDFIGDLTQTVVSISGSDTGFYADSDCGTWTYLGP